MSWRKRPATEENSANLPPADVIAAEIVEDLEAALQQTAAVSEGNLETTEA